jgi:hypothetical protein
MKLALAAFACTFGLVSVAAYADPPPPAHDSVCISVSDIGYLSYPDDKTIVFHMRGGKVRNWSNVPPRACPGLKFERDIAKEIRGDTICSNMQVVFVNNRQAPCVLGLFRPFTQKLLHLDNVQAPPFGGVPTP